MGFSSPLFALVAASDSRQCYVHLRKCLRPPPQPSCRHRCASYVTSSAAPPSCLLLVVIIILISLLLALLDGLDSHSSLHLLRGCAFHISFI